MSTSVTSPMRLRRELAAAFRLAEKFGYSEGICNHFSVVVPGSEERYLINPYGLHWSEMRPESLLLIDGDGQVIEGDGAAWAFADPGLESLSASQKQLLRMGPAHHEKLAAWLRAFQSALP